MIEFGFEREFFLVRDNEVLIAADHHIPHDNCGYLAEARGGTASNPLDAAYLLLAEERRIEKTIPVGTKLEKESRKLSRSFTFNCMRRFGKVVASDFSVSGKWNNRTLSHAGLHIHFSNKQFIKTNY